ncbi:MAG: endolytic transglycosylase MltG [Candidatus Paceibacterota bacterium]
MRLSTISIISSCIIIGIIAAIFIYQLQPPARIATQSVAGGPSQSTNQLINQQTKVILDIPQKLSFAEITEKLSQSGLIRSKKVFKIYSLITGRAHRFKPGKYFFPPAGEAGLSTPELTKILVAGPAEIPIIIYPGMTLKEIDERLTNSGIIQKNELINFNRDKFDNLKTRYSFLEGAKSLEGFLLPDTYYFFPVTEPDLTIQKILGNFKLKALPFFDNNANILKTLILASLLEKEIPDNNERQVAAGILEKRLSVGMALQVDATIVYIKCEGRFSNCPTLLKEDYKIDSPYNTYLEPGLPPTPISNPSLEAIKSAIEPIKTDYWYYLSDPETKRTIFSKTLEEHNKNKVKYLNK